MAWDDERVELLKKLWAEGLSASQIASRMGGVTRNAVIGKVHRLGLSGRATPAAPKRGRSFDEVMEETEEPVRRTPTLKPVREEPEFMAPIVLDGGDRTTVATLKNNMCKWPIGDPAKDDFHFCGQNTSTGKSYCAYHAHLAFQPAQQRRIERPAAAELARLAEPRRRAAG